MKKINFECAQKEKSREKIGNMIIFFPLEYKQIIQICNDKVRENKTDAS